MRGPRLSCDSLTEDIYPQISQICADSCIWIRLRGRRHRIQEKIGGNLRNLWIDISGGDNPKA
jgi:hypothetical protein